MNAPSPTFQVKKIGFYGGTFNPIHLGHLNLLIELKEIHQLDEIWLCPTFISPFKTTIMPAPPMHRLEMVKLAASDLPYVHVIEPEIQKKEVSFTIDTLTALSNENKQLGHQVLLHLLLGDDCLFSLSSWKNIHEIIAEYPLLIGSRTRVPPSLQGLDASLMQAIEKGLTKTQLMEISSTTIRNRIKHGLYAGHLLPSKVLDYINHHQLYH